MTRSRDALLRYHRWQVDEQRRRLAGLNAKRDQIIRDGEAFEAQILEEQALARHSALAGFAYSGFAGAVIDRRAEQVKALADLDNRIEEAQSDLLTAFLDLKRLEIMEDRRRETARKDAARAEQKALDDLAAQRFSHTK